MISKNLIIGRNSYVISTILKYLTRCDLASHKDYGRFDFEIYKHIFIFSWDFHDIEKNYEILFSLPPEKVVFISTTAVYSLLVRKQYSKYPLNKYNVEKAVLERGGRIIRLGVINKNIVKNFYGSVPYTSPYDLAKLIDSTLDLPRITLKFNIVTGELKGIRKILSVFLYKMSNIGFLQLISVILARILRISSYGYTKDSSRVLSDPIQIGYGAFGSVFYESNNLNHLVIVSNKSNEVLNESGFKLTRIGYSETGLSKFWHGVRIKTINNRKIKCVPAIVSRPKLPPNTIRQHVTKIEIEDSRFKIILDKFDENHLYLSCDRLIIACGALVNSVFVSKWIQEPVVLSDHEILYIGGCDTVELIQKKYLRRFLFLIFGRKVFHAKVNSTELLVDFRPYVDSKVSNESMDFYTDQTHSIFIKLLKNFNFPRINEAFFNKFGIAIYTPKFSLFAQILHSNCITVNCDNFVRNRFTTDDLTEFAMHVSQYFNSFKHFSNLQSVDAQHITGGDSTLKNHFIADLIRRKKLVIVGSPIAYKLTSAHHTSDIQDLIKSNHD